jgi:catechol-2,3-dioxygenase
MTHALPEDCKVDIPAHQSVVKPYCLGHGTLECRSLKESRVFYEEFLGLECAPCQAGPGDSPWHAFSHHRGGSR